MIGSLSFIKACALGNDFVIITDHTLIDPTTLPSLSQKMADRRWGVGCDQVIYVYPAGDNGSIHNVRFFNSDGSEAEACGNGSLCVAKLLIQRYNLEKVTLQTAGGTLDCTLLKDGTVRVVLPKPVCVQTIDLNIFDDFGNPSAVFVDLGNPHLVCFVNDLSVCEKWGPLLETYLPKLDPTMPQRVNVGFATEVDRQTLHLRVWERGAGFTQACGTGACAAAAAGQALGLIDHDVQVKQQGGVLGVHLGTDHFLMQGEAQLIYAGSFLAD
ncbi:diaminopimelate epimerase [Candidatus Finniella inopinata]|uniref:Diaminopimelate epimerase n=1 Tax=Candidatus Finniella inopinata TaxID=1696036 RepID=A0A4V2DZX7_9PROT|nr:diaminopimelate epimerase [Candidatus Finniella inopinata]RZI46597.1 diaminopimelate epimerase [Candidatus Finniella inopinata]